MTTRSFDPRLFYRFSLFLISVFFCVYSWFAPAPASAQEPADQEVAVNLSEGRVVICAAKDAILLVAMDTRGEAGSLPPAITILSAERIGVMMGAVEWVLPDSKDKPIRLNDEFKSIVGAALNTSGRPDYAGAANDIESIGVAVLERLRLLAGSLHHKVNLAEDEPLLRVVLVDYLRDYGPEAWAIDYHIRQDALGNDIWRTRVLRPGYNQIYPPEKGRPHTLMEVRYPPENRATDAPELLDLLQQNDPRLAGIRASSAIVAKSVGFVTDGQSQKSEAAGVATFLKAALPAVTPPETKLTMAMVDFDRGFQWIIEPPQAPAQPPSNKEKTPAEPERPTLRHKSGS